MNVFTGKLKLGGLFVTKELYCFEKKNSLGAYYSSCIPDRNCVKDIFITIQRCFVLIFYENIYIYIIYF